MNYRGLIQETRKRIEQLEEQYSMADSDTEPIVFYQLQAEKARLRLLLKEAKEMKERG